MARNRGPKPRLDEFEFRTLAVKSMSSIALNTSHQKGAASRVCGPFDPGDDDAYRRWRDAKLAGYPQRPEKLFVEIADLAHPTAAEQAAITTLCGKANMAIYVTRRKRLDPSAVRDDLLTFARAFGLNRMEGHRSAAEDGVVALEIARDNTRSGYIPYTNRPLSWHTDGYYNAPEDRIRSFILHCCRNAERGGENALLDPEIAYIRLRDENPRFIAALMHDEAMTIPANHEANGSVRPESVGPVYSVDRRSGTLRMRYTARRRYIAWRDDPDTRDAAAFITDMLAGGEPFIFRHKLEPGQGIICNNVLHARAGFDGAPSSTASSGRLLYRIRYQDQIAGTGCLDGPDRP